MFNQKVLVARLDFWMPKMHSSAQASWHRKGLSAIVATIALVFLTFVAILIVISFIVPFVQNNLTRGGECVAYQNYFVFEEDFGYNCFNLSSSNYLVSVRAANSDEKIESEIKGFKLVFIKGGDAVALDVDDGNLPSSSLFMYLGGNINIPESGEVRTFIYNTTQEFDAVEISPKLKNGRVCDKTDRIKLEEFC